MRKLILTTAASAALMTALSLMPTSGAQAMTPGNASGMRAALAETSPLESVRCWRSYSGRVVCRRGYYRDYYGAYPGYYGYPGGYYGGYGPGVGIYGPGVGIGIGIGPRWGW